MVEAADLGLAEEAGPAAAVPHDRIALGDDVSLEDVEREHLARVVARALSFEAAARILGIDVTTLQRSASATGWREGPSARFVLRQSMA